jgi:hypothetical protein
MGIVNQTPHLEELTAIDIDHFYCNGELVDLVDLTYQAYVLKADGKTNHDIGVVMCTLKNIAEGLMMPRPIKTKVLPLLMRLRKLGIKC